ncbi:YciI family protein [Paenibacillus sp. ACRRX]|uniref:YciI family protein n=1 Tax=unclassified Paenibacillus TaxID=185978 RepID=UPI001EF46854|nr:MULTISPECIES: YciI family protein [unclassified Paenibacillus]MCG7408146.1 YciI family protein [Paenibacillus sp. ACRRX]MDK8181471.1 YciI family protein [Paenibacillus sp. UMB4589-SE434]
MYLVTITYTCPVESVDKYLDGHRAFLDMYYAADKFIISGPFEPRSGGLIVVDTEDEDELEAILSADPFYQHGVARYDRMQFRPTKATDCLRDRLSLG